MSTSANHFDSDQEREFRLIEAKLETARKELLETTTRTRLLNTPLSSTRAKIVEIKDELSEQVFDTLVRNSAPMSFQPTPEEEQQDLAGQLPAQPDDDEAD